MNIESFFPGRIRVQSRYFTKAENIKLATAKIETAPGVKSISANPVTGSMTISYDPSAVTMEMLMEAKKDLEELEQSMGSNKA